MEVVFLKFCQHGDFIKIPTGCIRFRFQDIEIANDETVCVQVDSVGNLYTLAIDIDCVIFKGDTLDFKNVKWSALSIVTNESFEQELKRQLQLAHYSERELYALENIEEVQGNGLQAVI